MPRRRKAADDTNAAELYAKLHECMGYNASALRAQALLLNAGKKNRTFMKMASAEMGRNARHRARAVDYFEPYFVLTEPSDVLTVDQYLSLFAYASLPHEAAIECFAANKFDFPLYVIRERIAAMKTKRGKVPTLAERCAALVRDWRKIVVDLDSKGLVKESFCVSRRADELGALPEVARVLERKESDGKA